jgi:DNA-binding response OmpR family regulator
MTRILIVDDEAVSLMIMQDTLESAGYAIDQAEDGETAWQMMQAQSYDLIVLDRIMPGLNGLDLIKRIKADSRWKNLPVIMQTAASKQQEILEGMEAGAYYYLTKPYEPKVLRMLVSAVVTDLAEKAKLKEAEAHLEGTLALFEHGELRFRTLDEARHIAAAMASLCREGTSADTGLLELLVNAIEHGNLGITYQEKSQLRLEGQWEVEVERRLTQAPWSSRQARLSFRRAGDIVEFTVIDEGDGFDWKPYLTFDPSRAFDLNGRGIAMANMMSFAAIEYQGNGNTVIARATAAQRS